MGFSSERPVVLTWKPGSEPGHFTIEQSRPFTDGWQMYTDVIQGLVQMPEVLSARRSLDDNKVHIIKFRGAPTMRLIRHIEQYVTSALAGIRTGFAFNRDMVKLDDVLRNVPRPSGLDMVRAGVDAVDAQLAGGRYTYKEAYEALKKYIEQA